MLAKLAKSDLHERHQILRPKRAIVLLLFLGLPRLHILPKSELGSHRRRIVEEEALLVLEVL